MKGGFKLKFQEILKSKLVMCILIFIVVSLIAVIAGDVIVREGAIDVSENLDVSGNITTTGNAQLGDATTDYHGINLAPTSTIGLNLGFSNSATSKTIHGYSSDVDDTASLTSAFLTNQASGFFANIDSSGTISGLTAGKYLYGIRTDVDAGDTFNGGGAEGYYYGGYFDANFAGTNTDNSGISIYGTYISATGNMGTTGSTKHYGSYINVAGTSDANYGLFLSSSGATTNYALYIGLGNVFLGGDNIKSYFGTGADASISYDGTNMIFISNETSNNGMAWFSNNVSAEGFVTRTSVFDKSKGNALSYIKDADELKTNGIIDDSKFYGYVTYPVRDENNCWNVEDKYCWEVNNQTICEEEVPEDIKDYTIIYRTECGTKTEEAVSLNAEIDLLRQAVYELKTELCKKDNSYGWC